jgi:hypothetical protein
VETQSLRILRGKLTFPQFSPTVMLFTLAFLVVEPYKRKKLAQTFEARLLKGEEQNAAMLASVVEGFEKRVASMQEQGGELEKSLRLLVTRAGVDAQDGAEKAGGEGDETVAVVPMPSYSQSVKDKRRELALAGGLGFAVGAGILAAMGALRS